MKMILPKFQRQGPHMNKSKLDFRDPILSMDELLGKRGFWKDFC
jgi:hypothetical protein